MHLRTKLSQPALTVAIVALLLGTVGGASAHSVVARLSKHSVKQIANHVVTQRAPGLSVKNAKHLKGKPGSAYLDNAKVYRTDVATGATSIQILLPQGRGSYQISYSAYMIDATAGDSTVYCYVHRIDSGGSTIYYAGETEATITGTSSAAGVSGTAVVRLASQDSVHLDCGSGMPFHTASDEPIQVIVTPLDKVSNGQLPATRGGAAPHRQ